MNATASFLAPAQLRQLAARAPVYYTPAHRLTPWAPDHLLALAAPVVAYWAASLLFHAFDVSDARWLDAYRIHDSAEVRARNLASRWDVLKAVVFQHVVQTLMGLWWIEDKPAGELVDHLAGVARKSRLVLGALKLVLGEHAATGLWLSHGHEIAYFVYWWAIPSLKFLFGT